MPNSILPYKFVLNSPFKTWNSGLNNQKPLWSFLTLIPIEILIKRRQLWKISSRSLERCRLCSLQPKVSSFLSLEPYTFSNRLQCQTIVDLNKEKRVVSKKDAQAIADSLEIPYFEISSKTGESKIGAESTTSFFSFMHIFSSPGFSHPTNKCRCQRFIRGFACKIVRKVRRNIHDKAKISSRPHQQWTSETR